MGVTVDELARRVNGQICGDGRLLIEGAESIEKAGPADITFVTDDRNLRRLKTSQAGAVLVRTADVAAFHAACPQFTLIAVADPQQAFMEVLAGFRPARPRPALGISPHAVIDPSAVIGADCNIYPGVCVGPNVEIGPGCDIHPGVVIGDDCRIGAGCTLYPQVVLYAGCVLGNRVMVHASAILGADGFGYRFADGRFHKIPQLGSVWIQDDVEIGAGTTVDRGMIGPTIVGEGTKLDNQVMIGHNCELGRHNAFASQVGFAGSVTTGDYVRCAGQVGVADHVHLGTGCVLGAKAGVHKDMPGGKNYLGIPATEENDQIRIVMALRKLPALRKQMRDLENQVQEITRQLASATNVDTPRLREAG